MSDRRSGPPRALVAVLPAALVALAVGLLVQATGWLSALEQSTVNARFALRSHLASAGDRRGGDRSADVDRARAALAVPALAARRDDRPPPCRRGGPDRLRRPVHRADRARAGSRPVPRGRPSARDGARHLRDRPPGTDEHPRRQRATRGDRRVAGVEQLHLPRQRGDRPLPVRDRAGSTASPSSPSSARPAAPSRRRRFPARARSSTTAVARERSRPTRSSTS